MCCCPTSGSSILTVMVVHTILEVKGCILFKKGIAVEERVFGYAYKLLLDDCALRDCAIHPMATLHLILRLRGGTRGVRKVLTSLHLSRGLGKVIKREMSLRIKVLLLISQGRAPCDIRRSTLFHWLITYSGAQTRPPPNTFVSCVGPKIILGFEGSRSGS